MGALPKNGDPWRVELEFKVSWDAVHWADEFGADQQSSAGLRGKHARRSDISESDLQPLDETRWGKRKERVLFSVGGCKGFVVLVSNAHRAPILRWSGHKGNYFGGAPGNGCTEPDSPCLRGTSSTAEHADKCADPVYGFGCGISEPAGSTSNEGAASDCYATCGANRFDNGRWHLLLIEWDGEKLRFGADGYLRVADGTP